MQHPLASAVLLVVLVSVPACSDRTPPRAASDEPAHALLADAEEVLLLDPADAASLGGPLGAAFDALALALGKEPVLSDLVVIQPDEGATLVGDDKPPRFLWRDSAEAADTWWIEVRPEERAGVGLHLLVPGGMPAEAALDVFSASLHAWAPSPETWKHFVRHATGSSAVVTFVGFAANAPGAPLSRGSVTIRVSSAH